MASFESLSRWEKYYPALGNNRDLAGKGEPAFFLRVKAGLTKPQFEVFRERAAALNDSTPETLTAAVGDLVQMGDEPLTVDGKPVATLTDYLELILQQQGGDLFQELLGFITWANHVGGAQALFSERLFGGAAFTRPSPGMAAARSGTATNR